VLGLGQGQVLGLGLGVERLLHVPCVTKSEIVKFVKRDWCSSLLSVSCWQNVAM
jgi:hypothetical protein